MFLDPDFYSASNSTFRIKLPDKITGALRKIFSKKNRHLSNNWFRVTDLTENYNRITLVRSQQFAKITIKRLNCFVSNSVALPFLFPSLSLWTQLEETKYIRLHRMLYTVLPRSLAQTTLTWIPFNTPDDSILPRFLFSSIYYAFYGVQLPGRNRLVCLTTCMNLLLH